MYKLCKTEKSASRQRVLEQGLLKAMHRQRFDEISISDLCDGLDIPRKSFYRYFSSKEGALFALVDHTIMEFYDDESTPMFRGGTPMEDMKKFFRFWYERRNFISALERSQLTGIMVQRAVMLAEKEHLMPGYQKKWSPQVQRMAISFAVCGMMSLLMEWHKDNYQSNPEEIAKLAVGLLSNPLLL